jgi:hypothetical protein
MQIWKVLVKPAAHKSYNINSHKIAVYCTPGNGVPIQAKLKANRFSDLPCVWYIIVTLWWHAQQLAGGTSLIEWTLSLLGQTRGRGPKPCGFQTGCLILADMLQGAPAEMR